MYVCARGESIAKWESCGVELVLCPLGKNPTASLELLNKFLQLPPAVRYQCVCMQWNLEYKLHINFSNYVLHNDELTMHFMLTWSSAWLKNFIEKQLQLRWSAYPFLVLSKWFADHQLLPYMNSVVSIKEICCFLYGGEFQLLLLSTSCCCLLREALAAV